MSITAPSPTGRHDDVDQLTAATWLDVLLDLTTRTSAVLYDRNMTIRTVAGDVRISADLDVGLTVGQRIPDVVPADVWVVFDPHLQAPFEGRTVEFEYFSPRTDTEYRLSCHPVPGVDGTVRAGLLVGQEVTEDHRRRDLAEEIQRSNRVGWATYDRRRGWRADAELLALLEVSTIEELLDGLHAIVLPSDQPAVRSAINHTLTHGGRQTLRYRIRRARKRDVRHVLGTVTAVVDEQGSLVHAFLTYVDITPEVIQDGRANQDARTRIRLMRQAGDLLAQRFHSRRSRIRQIADLTAVALGEGTTVRVIATGDGDDHLDLLARNAGDLSPPEALSATDDPAADPHSPHQPNSYLYSSIGNPDWRTTYQGQMGVPIDPSIQHFISAPIRHDGSVLGAVHAFRFDGRPLVSGDDDMLQVMSDRIGWVIAAGRTSQLLKQQADETRLLGDRLGRLLAEHRELLAQLSTVEERERLLLAETIHDEPLQLVVAATMRLDILAGNPGHHSDEIEQVILILEDAIGKLRTLITALCPPDMTDGLGVALNRLAHAVFVTAPSVTVAVTGPTDVSLSPARKMNVWRILREGLVNARKHARAKHIWLSLREAEGFVVAELSDDGAGATDLDPRPGHLGVATMHGRATAEDGRLDVHTAPGEGTTLVLTVPIDAPVVPSSKRIEES